MSAPPNRRYSRFIVAPDAWPTTRESCEAKAAAWQQAAAASSSAADNHRTAINGLRADGVAQSATGFEAMNAAYWRNQVEADDLADTRSAAADLMRNIAEVQKEAEQRIDSIDAEAHRQLASAPLHSPKAIGIISSAAGLVRSSATDAATSITALSGNFASKFGPPESPVRDTNSGQTDGGERPSPPAKSPGEATDDDFGGSGRPDPPRGQTGVGGETGEAASSTSFGGERPAAVPPAATATPATPAAPPTSPLRAPGGLPGFGGGGVSAGSSPLSAGGGIGGSGGMPSGLRTGLSRAGSAGSATASGPASPAAAFSRGLSAFPPPTPFASGAAASSAATTAPPTAPAAPLAAAPASSGGAPHVPPIASAPNVVALQPVSGVSGASASAPAQALGAPGLSPSGPMGPPAAAAVSTAAATAGPTTATMAPATASVATAAAVATPVATLPSQIAAAAARDFERLRNESSDLQMVKRLAWQLLAAGESGRSFALWAVGMMYSAAGERQVVAVSHHGAGYVPPGIAVPIELRMAWADPFINDAFRQRWTGNLDPAATLVAYAELKAGEAAAWRLGAAATTWAEVDALMAAAQRWGTEWAACTGMNMPGGIDKQAMTVGAEPTHRLTAEFPELAVEVAELKPRGLDHRAAKLITDALVSEARLVVVKFSTMPGESRLPANFDDVWPAAADSGVPAAERARFAEAVQQQWLSVGIAQPGWDLERSASIDSEYRGRWLISRALEAVLGWIADPGTDGKPAELPMADIVYAAAHAHLDGRGTDWITDLFTQAERSRA